MSRTGFLPAELIETPPERLARLNKHRNIDLVTAMLSDTVREKSQNPFKKAMRRRNVKTVQFADPIHHGACGYEYSLEKEGGKGENDDKIEVYDDANEAEGSGKKAAGPTKRNSG
jgi:hypothetical protein